jgi:dTDP-4-amino-4,6-dideoxygalactose transaminase
MKNELRAYPEPIAIDSLPAIAGGTPTIPRDRRIIFQTPIITDEDVARITDCLRSLWIGKGPRVDEFEKQFAAYKSAPYAAAVSSCSAGLHLALLALGIGPGDEVIAPTMTFCSTVHAILHVGATPVLADCHLENYNILPADIERKLGPRTKAVIVVHMAGRPCQMDAILDIARAKNLRVIEDCAHAIEAKFKGIPSGLMGDIGCFSFYPTKNLTTGDGGMVITASRRLFRRVKLLSQNGVVADAWARETGRIRNRIVAPGYKYNMTDIEASLGMAQLAALESRWVIRQHLCKMYLRLLQHPAIIQPAQPDPESRHAHHLFAIHLRLESLRATRDQIAAAMSAENVGTGVHYVPVHQQPYYKRRFRFSDSQFPNASILGPRTLSLPLSGDLTDDQIASICTALHRILDYFSPR